MSTNTVSLRSYFQAAKQAAGIPAAGWSEAAGRYSEWLASEIKSGLVSESDKLQRAASELTKALSTAEANATTWADAARAAGDTGVARIMDKYVGQLQIRRQL